jgi:hypothetical protein
MGLSIAQLGSIAFVFAGIMLWAVSARAAAAPPHGRLQAGTG